MLRVIEASLHLSRLIGVTLLLLCCAWAVPDRHQGSLRPFSLVDDIGVTLFGDPYTGAVQAITFSPNLQYFVLVAERGSITRNRPETLLRIYRAADVQKFVREGGSVRGLPPIWALTRSTCEDGPIVTNLRWLRNSSQFAFLERATNGNNQLVVADITSKRIHILTPDSEDVTAYAFASLDRYVFATRSRANREKATREQRSQRIVGTDRSLESIIFPENLYPQLSKFYDLSELWRVTDEKRKRMIAKSTGRPVMLYQAGLDALSMSPDGTHIVTAQAVDTVPDSWPEAYLPPKTLPERKITPGKQIFESLVGTHYLSEYVDINVSDGRIKPLTYAPIATTVGWWSVIGSDWSSDGQFVVLSDTFLADSGPSSSPCVAVVNMHDGQIKCVEPVTFGPQTNRYIREVRFLSGTTPRLAVVDFSGESNIYQNGKEGTWVFAGTSRRDLRASQTIDVVVRQSFNSPPAVTAKDNVANVSQVLWDPNPQLKQIALATVTVFHWKDKTGGERTAGLFLPPTYMKGKRYPLVIQTHGFTEDRFAPSGLFPSAFAAQELAADGFIVLQVRDCVSALSSPEEGPCSVAGYDSAVKELVAQGIVDPDRIGIIGFSRTCYYVLLALTTGGVHFGAASITDGVNEGYLQYLTSIDDDESTIANDAEGVIGATPVGAGLQQWLTHSPTFRMEQVDTPLQVVAIGIPDVLFMWEPYAILRRLHKPVDLIVINSDQHILSTPAARMASQGGTIDWFRFWLQGYDDPDPGKAKQYKRWRELRNLQKANQQAQQPN